MDTLLRRIRERRCPETFPSIRDLRLGW